MSLSAHKWALQPGTLVGSLSDGSNLLDESVRDGKALGKGPLCLPLRSAFCKKPSATTGSGSRRGDGAESVGAKS